MDAPSLYRYFQVGGVKALIVDVAQVTAVYCVGEVSAKSGHIKAVCAPAYFLVGRKGDANFPVRDFFVENTLRQRHDFGHSGLVVCAEQSCAVGNHQFFTDMVCQMRKIGHFHPDFFFGVQQDIAALIRNHFGRDALATCSGGGVDVGD